MRHRIIKLMFRILGAVTFVSGILCTTYLLGKYLEIYYFIGSKPSGLNISIYDEQYSRGFTWWTEELRFPETQLYLSETIFAEDDFCTALETSGDISNQHFDGVILVEGETQSVADLTKWGRRFSISYCNHSVVIENLLPEQMYHYAVGGNGEYLFGQFRADSNNETIIINFNDFQTSDGEMLYLGADTLKAALQCVNEPIDFFAFGGDFTSTFSLDNQTYSHLTGWIKSRESLADCIDGIPMIMVPGNHDAENQLFCLNNSISYDGSSGTGGYYSFDYDSTHFTILNSNEFDSEQYKWVQRDLAQANHRQEIRWIVLMLHAGPYTTGDNGLSVEKEYVEAIGYLASEYHVDLVLQAHDHTYSKTFPYCWDNLGYTESEQDSAVINRSPQKILYNGIEYDYDPSGTYYVSCGASGHRLGENIEYALSYGEKSYINRHYKVAVSEVEVDSEYLCVGAPASMDLGKNMFGIIRIQDNTLTYEFYVAENGIPILIDRLAVIKSEIEPNWER